MSGPRCPYCGTIDNPGFWRSAQLWDDEDASGPLVCGGCNQRYMVHRRMTITYQTETLDGRPVQKQKPERALRLVTED